MNSLKFTGIFLIISVTGVILFSCNKSDKDNTQNEKQTTDQSQNKKKIDTTKLVKDGKYVCPMHPLMQSNDSMKCPVCKMWMESKASLNKQMMDEHESMESKFTGKKDAVHFEVNLSVLKSTECQAIIESALKSDAGILGYHVDILNKVAHMYFDKTKTNKEKIEKLISDTGFDANNTMANPDAVNKLPAECR